MPTRAPNSTGCLKPTRPSARHIHSQGAVSMALFLQVPGMGDARSGELVRHGIGQRTRTLPAACKGLQAARRKGLRVRETRIVIRSYRRIQQPHGKDDPQGLRIPRSGLSRTQTPPSFRHALTTETRVIPHWRRVGRASQCRSPCSNPRRWNG
jgi:hypothetical protein